MFEEFKKEHTDIIDNFRNVKKLNIHTREGQLELQSAINNILAHIKKENQILYPALKESMGLNSQLRETLNAFDKDMAVISRYTRNFFDSIFAEAKIDHELELEKFFEIHCTRFLREEAILFAKRGNSDYQWRDTIPVRLNP